MCWGVLVTRRNTANDNMESAIPSETVSAPPQPANTAPSLLSEKLSRATQLEPEIKKRTQEWQDAHGKEVVAGIIFRHFKTRVLQTHGEQFDLSSFFGNLKTISGLNAYTSHIFKHLPKLCTVTGEGENEVISVEDAEVKPRIDNIVAHFKEAVHPDNIANIALCLIQYDFYIPVLEATATEISKLDNRSAQAQGGNSAPPAASPAMSLRDLDLEDHHLESDWEETEDRGECEKRNTLSTLSHLRLCLSSHLT